MGSRRERKAKLYKRYPFSSVAIYNGSTVLHFALGGVGIALGYRSAGWIGATLGLAYLAWALIQMYLVMPLSVCRHCVYYWARDARCISGLNALSRRIANPGQEQRFTERAQGWLCANNLYLASLIVPILAIIPALIISLSLLVIFVVLLGLLLYRFFYFLPKVACLHCRAKYICPQAGAMGVRNL